MEVKEKKIIKLEINSLRMIKECILLTKNQDALKMKKIYILTNNK